MQCKPNVRIKLIATICTSVLSASFLIHVVQAGAHQAPTTLSPGATKSQDMFDVVSIKQVDPDSHPGYSGPSECGGSFNIDPQVFTTSGVTLYTLIGWAYANRGFTTNDCLTLNKFNFISGGPTWARSDRFDIHALMPDRSSRYTDKQLEMGDVPKLRVMIRSLLENRFKLVLHSETREMAAYALTVGRGGFKLKPLVQGSCPPRCGSINIRSGNRNFMYDGQGFERLAPILSVLLDRPLVDRTGVTGPYDVELTFAADEATPGIRFNDPASGASDPAPTLSTALQEQLGLKLESIKWSTEVFIVDHDERPVN
jgi:uncharacterized protein (TIGR03435 family)